jgi:TPR repeat protein
MKIVPYATTGCVVFAAISCKESASSSGAQSFALSKAQIVSLEEQATAGNADAAYTLARYHGNYELDEKSYLKWLEIAANAGHKDAQAILNDLRANR